MSLDVVQAVKVVLETVGLSEPKQGWDLLFSRGIVKFLTHWVGGGGRGFAGLGMMRKSPTPRQGVQTPKMWELLEVALDLTLRSYGV